MNFNQFLHSFASNALFQLDVIKMPTTPERSQVIPGAPENHFRGVKHSDVLFPKALHPQILSHVEPHKGDGGEGTISTYVVRMCLNLFTSHAWIFGGSSSCSYEFGRIWNSLVPT